MFHLRKPSEGLLVIWSTSDLDDFVARSDKQGGPGAPGCQAFWSDFSLRINHQVNQELDPFSDAYVEEQMIVYQELANRKYDPVVDENTIFDTDRHIRAANPYDHPDSSTLAKQIQTLSRALRLGCAARGEVLLDLGCGWGLSSEVAAYLGLRVEAIDINSEFVRLVNERARHGGKAIKATAGTFLDFQVSAPVDVALFYECLHHAVRPWAVMDRVASSLKTGGRVLLVNEPINDFWWKHWGMRLDALSVYCIRKFGWFESGWSLPFIKKVLLRSGLTPQVFDDPDGLTSTTVIATKSLERAFGRHLVDLNSSRNCVADGQHLILAGRGRLIISVPSTAVELTLCFANYRSAPLRTSIEAAGRNLIDGEAMPGPLKFTLPCTEETVTLNFIIERWVPDEEIGNGDKRIIGIHLLEATFIYKSERL